MKVKFFNTEVDVWRLRKGVVLGVGSVYAHLDALDVFTSLTKITVIFSDGMRVPYDSELLEWVEPH